MTPTWKAAKAAGELAERKRVERQPAVAAVLERFPGATVTAISPAANGQTARSRRRSRRRSGRDDASIDADASRETFIAAAMERRRRELIAQPLARIWPELAKAAIEADGKFNGALGEWPKPESC